MTTWLVAALVLLPAFAVAVFAGCAGITSSRLVALQLANALAGLVLITLTFAFDQPGFIDIPLCLSLLTLPGTLIIMLFLERWL